MPRTRKPQVARPAGRVASTTTWATKNVPSPMVYRIPTGRRDYSCEWKIVGSGVAPIHVRWIDEHEFQVSINEAELRGKIENWENLDLSNVEVTLSEVNWPVTITGSLNYYIKFYYRNYYWFNYNYSFTWCGYCRFSYYWLINCN